MTDSGFRFMESALKPPMLGREGGTSAAPARSKHVGTRLPTALPRPFATAVKEDSYGLAARDVFLPAECFGAFGRFPTFLLLAGSARFLRNNRFPPK